MRLAGLLDTQLNDGLAGLAAAASGASAGDAAGGAGSAGTSGGGYGRVRQGRATLRELYQREG